MQILHGRICQHLLFTYAYLHVNNAELWAMAPNLLVQGQPLQRQLYLTMTYPRLLIQTMNGSLSGLGSGIDGFFQVAVLYCVNDDGGGGGDDDILICLMCMC